MSKWVITTQVHRSDQCLQSQPKLSDVGMRKPTQTCFFKVITQSLCEGCAKHASYRLCTARLVRPWIQVQDHSHTSSRITTRFNLLSRAYCAISWLATCPRTLARPRLPAARSSLKMRLSIQRCFWRLSSRHICPLRGGAHVSVHGLCDTNTHARCNMKWTKVLAVSIVVF